MKKLKQNKKLNDYNRIFISKAKIGNLKAFKGENEIEFAPMINLIFGKNSSGKSTINQALRLFRQSYGFKKLTPFNYESPTELRGQGGLDIDIGYQGLINNGNTNAKMSLGIETGLYQTTENKIIQSRKSIHYTYKFKKKFYTGKNLVSERTILDKIYFSNPGGEALVELPRHVFFQDESDLGRSIRRKERYVSGDFLGSARGRETSDSIYKSVYDPYYYTTLFKPENIQINSLEEIFSETKRINKKVIVNFYNQFLIYLEKRRDVILEESLNDVKVGDENKDGVVLADYDANRKEMAPLQEVALKIRDKRKGNIEKQITDFQNLSENFFKLYENEYIEFDNSPDLKLIEIDKFIKSISALVKFFKKPNITSTKFIEFFKKDICEKCKDVIFFNGYFIDNSSKEGVRHLLYEDKFADAYLINIFIFLIESNSLSRKTINIFNGYQSHRYRGSNMTAMVDISKAMNKFVVAPGLRQIPKRYFVKGLQTDYVGPSAENLGELLANPEIKKATNKWFEILEIPYKVDIQKSGNYYEIIFLPKHTKIKISSMHIGLGYPLILPFIVQCIIAKNKIILIEEPEVHLHPKLEADLADLIVESSIQRNNQFIIETHSEDFLLRILKSIRKEKLKPEHVSVNYITPSEKNGSKINKITINKYGQYTTPWKDDLFADRIKELK